jgi:hypothetical protein
MTERLFVGIALVVASGIALGAQSLPAPPGPKGAMFEVASIKRNRTDEKGPRRAEPDRFVSIGWPLRFVIATAYRAKGFQVLGGPAWIDTDFFDINAKAPEKTPPVDDAPTLFDAVQQQLGLKLQSERAPVDVLVIDSVEPPTPD